MPSAVVTCVTSAIAATLKTNRTDAKTRQHAHIARTEILGDTFKNFCIVPSKTFTIRFTDLLFQYPFESIIIKTLKTI